MNVKTLLVFFWLTLIGAAAAAGDKQETHIKIKVDDGADTFEWHSDDADLNLEDLDVGESRTLTSEGGKEATVTRTADGFVFEVDGEAIDVLKFRDGNHTKTIHGDHDVVVESDKRIEKRIKVIRDGDDEAVTIVSTGAIDEAKRARIEAALKEAGVEGEVLFLDGSELHEHGQAHARRELRIIRKEKDATN